MIYGWRGAKIASYKIPNTICRFCNCSEPQRVTEFGKYAHVMWIPLFPIGKSKVSECTSCLRTIEEKDFPSDLRANMAEKSSAVKRPIWHYLGLILIGGFIALSTIAGGLASVFGDNTPDPRQEMLSAYENQMKINPAESDSLATTLKSFYSSFVSEELDISKNEYFTTADDDKIMILARFPNLKKVEKSERIEVVNMVDMLLDSYDNIKNKDRYIGVYGKYNLMVSKTPDGTRNSRLALDKDLLEYFGSKPVAKPKN